jgi:hypothetical protein
MNAVSARRSEIYDYFHSNAACQKYFFDAAHEEEFVAYYNSMYLLADATEALLHHRALGFSSNPLLAYLEFWGVMQAVIIQQDSIAEIHDVIICAALDYRAKDLESWIKVREFRNVCAGHPTRKDRPKKSPTTRTFMKRGFGDYDLITFEQWQHGHGVTHPDVRLGALIDAYAIEAENELKCILKAMQSRWPSD